MDLIIGQIGNQMLALPLELLREHVVVNGRTGSGKSVFLNFFLLQLALSGEGVDLIDPDNDTAEDLEAYIAQFLDQLNPLRRREIVIVHPGTQEAIRLDPFDLDADASDYDVQLAEAVEETMEVLARIHGMPDYQETRRMKRVTRCILHLCGTKVNGKHSGLQTALDWLNMGTAAWERKFHKVRGSLPHDIAQELERLSKLPIGMRDKEIESTRNLFTSFLAGPLTKQIVTPGPSLDFRKAVRERHVLIWNLGIDKGLTREQRRTLAGIIYVKTSNACRDVRVRRFVCIEEAGSILGDYTEGLKQARKRKECLVLSNQDTAGYRDQRSDQRGTIYSQPGVHIFFQTIGPKEELEEAAHLLGTRSIDYSVNWKPIDRPDGYGILTLPEHQYSETTKHGERHAQASSTQLTRKEETGRTSHVGIEVSNGVETGRTSQRTKRHQNMRSHEIAGSNGSRTDDDKKSKIESHVETQKSNVSDGTDTANGEHQSTKQGASAKTGLSESAVTGLLNATGSTTSHAIETGRDVTDGVSFRNHLIPLTREEWYSAGLLMPRDAQYGKVETDLSGLGRSEFLMICSNLPMLRAEVPQIVRPFRGRTALQAWRVSELRAWIRSIHPFFFVPQKEPKCLPQVGNGKFKSRRGTGNSSNGS